MTDRARLAARVDAFARTVDDLRAIAARSDPRRRNDLAALRRLLAERIAQMRDVGLEVFADPVLADEFRSRLSQVLNLMALHQAKWPAVSIGADDEDYRRSAQQLVDANRGFVAWTRAALTRIA